MKDQRLKVVNNQHQILNIKKYGRSQGKGLIPMKAKKLNKKVFKKAIKSFLKQPILWQILQNLKIRLKLKRFLLKISRKWKVIERLKKEVIQGIN